MNHNSTKIKAGRTKEVSFRQEAKRNTLGELAKNTKALTELECKVMVAYYHHYGEDHWEISNQLNYTFSDKEYLVTGTKTYCPSMIKEVNVFHNEKLLIRYMPNYHCQPEDENDTNATAETLAEDVIDMHNYIQEQARQGGAGAWSMRELNRRYPKRHNGIIRNNYFLILKDFIDLLCRLFIQDRETQNYMTKRLPKIDNRTLLLIFKLTTFENPEVWSDNPVLQPLFAACKLIIEWVNWSFNEDIHRKLIKCTFIEAFVLNEIDQLYDEYQVVSTMHLVYFLDTLLAIYYNTTPYNSRYEDKIEQLLGSQAQQIPETPLHKLWQPILKQLKNKKYQSRITCFPPLNRSQIELILNSDILQFLTPFIIDVSRRNQRQEVVAD